MDVLGLPCSRDRHDDCVGEFVLGAARFRHRQDCVCSCHWAAAEAARDAYVALLDHDSTIELLPS